MSIQMVKISEPLKLGEGPHWDDRQQALYVVSINEKTIHKYVLATGDWTKTTLDGRVGFIVPVDGTTDQFVVGVERKFLVIRWDGQEGSAVETLRELGEVDQDKKTTRINDGKADPKGRLFAGTMGRENPLGHFENHQGSLFRVDGGKITTLAERVGISNGLAWDLKKKAFYYVDSLERNIRRYDYDVTTGEISNPTHIFDLAKNNIEGFPDGTTIDTDGNLWLAVYNGGAVFKIDPRTGKVLLRVPIPSKQVTSATFGGPNLDILFVTTAHVMKDEERKPEYGCTYMVTGLGVKGYPNVNFKL